MSQYNHMNDQRGNVMKCTECDEKFRVTETGNIWPGGKDTEFINCPYCHSENGSVRTSGFVYTHKIEE